MINYSNWGTVSFLCAVPKEIIQNINDHFDIITQKRSDNAEQPSYDQWLVQYATTGNPKETGFMHWNDNGLLDPTREFFSQYVKKIYRFRVSLLQENKEVDYHLKHELPRIHIPLNECDATFVIKEDDGKEYSLPFVYGNAYYTNVTKMHKVIGSDKVKRKNAFFSFKEFTSEEIKIRCIN